MPLSPITGDLFDVDYVKLQYPILADRLEKIGNEVAPVACADNPGIVVFFCSSKDCN